MVGHEPYAQNAGNVTLSYERRIVESELLGVGPLEVTCVGLKIGEGEWSSPEPPLHVTLAYSGPEHLHGFIEEVQFHTSAESTSTLPEGIPLIAPPRPPLDHDDLAEHEEAARELPLQPLDPRPRPLVEEVYAQGLHPLIRRQPYGAIRGFELGADCGLPRAWEAAYDDQPPRLVAGTVRHFSSMHERGIGLNRRSPAVNRTHMEG